jgi:hypothetical protein
VLNLGNKNQISGNFISLGDACNLLEQSVESRRMEHGGLSMHWLSHDTRGEVVLIQGANGEFALLSA